MVPQAPQGHQGCRGSLVHRGLQEHLEIMELMDNRVPRERQDQLVLQGPREQLDQQDQQARMGHRVTLGPRARRDPRGLVDSRVAQALRARLVSREILAFKDQQAAQDHKDLKVLRVLRVLPELLEPRAPQDKQGNPELLAVQDQEDPTDH